MTVSQGLVVSGGGFDLLPGKCYTNWKYVEVYFSLFSMCGSYSPGGNW